MDYEAIGTLRGKHPAWRILRANNASLIRLTELHRQRDAVDAQIAAVKAGQIQMMDETGVRDRYQQFTATARFDGQSRQMPRRPTRTSRRGCVGATTGTG